MRTTLTLDEGLAIRLRELARHTSRPFAEVVNDSIRRGLATMAERRGDPPPFVVQPKACGFRPGVDIDKLNQIDDLDL